MKIIWTEILKFLEFLILKNFSRILEKFHFSISISRQFHFTFHSRSRFWGIFISLFTLDLDIKAFSFHFSFSKWVKLIFISLFTSRNEWNRFSFHFSLLDFPISTLAGHCLCLLVSHTFVWPSLHTRVIAHQGHIKQVDHNRAPHALGRTQPQISWSGKQTNTNKFLNFIKSIKYNTSTFTARWKIENPDFLR